MPKGSGYTGCFAKVKNTQGNMAKDNSSQVELRGHSRNRHVCTSVWERSRQSGQDSGGQGSPGSAGTACHTKCQTGLPWVTPGSEQRVVQAGRQGSAETSAADEAWEPAPCQHLPWVSPTREHPRATKEWDPGKTGPKWSAWGRLRETGRPGRVQALQAPQVVTEGKMNANTVDGQGLATNKQDTRQSWGKEGEEETERQGTMATREDGDRQNDGWGTPEALPHALGGDCSLRVPSDSKQMSPQTQE